MKKISKFLFFALLVPLVAACDSFMPNFSRNGQPSEAPAPVSSSSKPTEQSSSQQKIEKYTITWVDWDGDTLISEKYEKGSWPTYKGLTPTRESENGIDFQFTGWLPEITEVNENRAYVAQYMTINSYEEQTSDKVQVKFLNYDGSILLESEYKKGRTPAYYGVTPVRPDEGDIKYTFAGWCPELGPVNVDTNFVATFTSSYQQSSFTVKWVNYDGVTLSESQYKIGDIPSYNGPTPTRAKEGEIEYRFTGWSPEVQPVYGDAVYVANFSSTYVQSSFKVRWLNYDGTLLNENTCSAGEVPFYMGATPTKPSDGDIDYSFTGWSPTVGPVYSDVTYVATFNSAYEQSSFTVKWVNWDGTTLSESQVGKGDTPYYNGANPTRASDGDIQYSFVGWNPSIGPTYSDTTYVATYSSSYDQSSFTVKFLNWDGSTLTSETYEKGSTPVYTGPTPTRASDGDIQYTFTGWNPNISPVYSDTSYVAVFSSSYDQSSYTVKFLNYDGTVLTSDVYEKGATPVYMGITPTRASDGDINYTFIGWNSTLQPVYGDATYVAVYSTSYVQSSFTVKWLNWDGSTLSEDTYSKGEYPTYTGPAPTRENDGDINYTFTGWNPSIEPVFADTTYVAVFSSSYVQSSFTIKFLDWDGKTLSESQYSLGAWPTYPGGNPTRASDGDINYTFTGWNPSIDYVNGDATYVAVYSSSYTQSTFTIRWVNYDGNVLETDYCASGEIPVYDGNDPYKPAEFGNNYVFTGWAPTVAPATCDTTYIAQFKMSNENIDYAITWYDWNGNYLYQDYFRYGSTPEYNHGTPIRYPDTDKTYAFSGWEPEITEVTRNASYKAVYESATRQYEVRWHDADGNIIYSEMVDYGAALQYNGEAPTRESDTYYHYTFTGWNNDMCYGDTDVYPRFESSYRQYKVTWANYDGTVIREDMVNAGDWPNYYGDTPTRDSEGQYSYYFDTWYPSMNSVTEDVTYTARYYENTRWVNIRFMDYEGNSIWSNSYVYGSEFSINFGSDIFSRAVPKGDADHYYELVGWDKEINNIANEDAVYNPVYEERNCVDNLILKLSQDGTHYVVIGYKDIPLCGHIGIPAEYNDLPITEIGAAAFRTYDYSITSIVMSDNVTTINNEAFGWCYGASITLSKNITTIGNYAFANINNLYEIDLPNVETIGDHAFEYCWSLNNVKLGSKLKEIGNGSFSYGVSNFEVENSEYFKAIDGILFTKDGKTLVAYPRNRYDNSYTIPDGVEAIGNGAFRGNDSLTSIVFPNTVSDIGECAFESCRNIKSIVIPELVTTIKNSTFSSCDGLENVELNDNLVVIENSAFYGCKSLTSIVLPEGLTSLGSSAFDNCSKLKTINIPSTVTFIGSSCFSNCKVLESIDLPNGLDHLESNLFSSCKNITTVIIPEGVTNIYWSCFNDCISLDQVILPSTITWINGNAFSGCYYLYAINFNGTMAEWEAIGKDSNWNYNCGITQVICTDGTINLGD